MKTICGKLVRITFVYLLLNSGLLFAQTLIGEVRSNEDGKAVPFAQITIEGTEKGSICNELGQFQIKLASRSSPSITLKASSLGYEDQLIKINPALLPKKLSFSLNPSSISLGTVQIIGVKISPKELYIKCLDQVSNNFSRQPYLLKSFYRHHCKEGNTYGRLIEAAVDIYDRKGYRNRYQKLSKKYSLRVSQLRRSLDFTAYSFYNHLPIALNRSLGREFAGLEIPYLKGYLKDQARFSFADTIFDSQGTILVVQAQTRWRGSNYTTDFYINMENFALVKMEEHESRSYFGETARSFRTNHYLVAYKKVGKSYFLSHLVNEGHLQSWRKGPSGNFEKRSDHSHKISWVVNEVLQEGFSPFKGKEPGREELQNMPFDQAFWDNYAPLRSTPLENRIRRDLSQRLELEKQFTNGNDEAWRDKDVAERSYQKFMQESQGRPRLIVFWESSNKPGPGELLTLRKLSRDFDELPVALLWVNLDADRQRMMKTIRRYGLYLGTHCHYPGKPTALWGYGFGQSPYLVLLDGKGKPLYEGKKLPAYKEIKRLLKPD